MAKAIEIHPNSHKWSMSGSTTNLFSSFLPFFPHEIRAALISWSSSGDMATRGNINIRQRPLQPLVNSIQIEYVLKFNLRPHCASASNSLKTHLFIQIQTPIIFHWNNTSFHPIPQQILLFFLQQPWPCASAWSSAASGTPWRTSPTCSAAWAIRLWSVAPGRAIHVSHSSRAKSPTCLI